MKKLLYLFLAMFITIGLNACSPDDNPIDDSDTETPENPNPDEPDDPDTPEPTRGKTLIVYYSFTNNVHTVINDLGTQIEADVIRVEPTEKGIDYAANNYAIGSAQIQAIRYKERIDFWYDDPEALSLIWYCLHLTNEALRSRLKEQSHRFDACMKNKTLEIIHTAHERVNRTRLSLQRIQKTSRMD